MHRGDQHVFAPERFFLTALSGADHSLVALRYNLHYRKMIVRYRARFTDIESALESAAHNRTDTM